MKTFMQSKETVAREWYVIDAKDVALGRVAAKAASMLRGKHKVTYTPHIDCGDNIIIINAKEVLLTFTKNIALQTMLTMNFNTEYIISHFSFVIYNV